MKQSPFRQENYFTEEHKHRLLPLFENDERMLLKFHKLITPAIHTATQNLTKSQRDRLNQKAVSSAKQFLIDLSKCDIFWDEIFCADNGFKKWMATNSLINTLEEINSRQETNLSGHSKYEPLAAAVGNAMTESGISKVSSYYNDKIYHPPHLGNAATVIEVCIDAAGIRKSNNLKQLASIAKKSSQINQ